MKRQLATNRLNCALFDSPRFVRNFEAALQRVAKPAAPRLPAPAHAVRPSPATVPARLDQIPIITVSHNAPQQIDTLLASVRRFHSNRVTIIDGSNPDVAERIRAIAARYDNVEFIAFGYDIGQGPGLAWAFEHLGLSGEALLLAPDVELVNDGLLAALHAELAPGMYGVGAIHAVNELGYARPDGALRYLDPACLLVNLDVVRQWPLPIKHGAPLIAAMLALDHGGNPDLIKHLDWVRADLAGGAGAHTPRFLQRSAAGAVKPVLAHHYDLPGAATTVNVDLLQFVPATARKLVEVGCGDGTFARAYRQRNPVCNITGIEAEPSPAQAARQHCDFVFHDHIDTTGAAFWDHVRGADCWILDQSLEHMDDPWSLLQKIRTSIAPGGKLVATINNFQHWSTQARLNAGDLRYGADGLDKSRKRVFTRGTALDLFQQAGFQVSGGSARIIDEPAREKYLAAIRLMAGASGIDPVQAVEDALPWQYIVTAVAA